MTKHSYRPDIDGLRTIAITSVVLFHASFTWMSGGFIGVDVFFVISGYLITRLLIDEAESTGEISFLKFYSKRIKRLFPALIFLLISILFIWGLVFIGNPERTKHLLRSIRYGIFGFANLFFLKNSGGYFDANTEEMPLLHFWSLGVEEQFYLIWPLLIFLVLKIGKPQRVLLGSRILLLSIILISFVYCEYLLSSSQQNTSFYSVFARAWELSVGGIIYLFETNIRIPAKRAREGLSILAIGSLLLSFVMYSSDTRFPGFLALLPTLSTAILIVTALQEQTLVSRFLSLKPIVYVGQLSYGWYLWHWPLLVFLRLSHHGEIPPLSERIFAIVGSLLLSAFSFHVIEKPFRSGRWIQKFRTKTVIVAAILTGLMVILVSQLLLKIEDRGMTDEWRGILELANERTPYRFDCDFSIASRSDPRCVANLEGEESYIVVWGDSHAQAFFPVFEELARDLGKRAILLANSAVPPLLGIEKIYYQNKSESLDVESYQKRILSSLDPSKIYKIVLIARWPAYLGTKPISVADSSIFFNPEKSSTKSLDQLAEGLRSIKNQVESKGISDIYVFESFLEYKYEVKNCRSETGCDLSKQTFLNYRQAASKVLRSVFLGRTLDPTVMFCGESKCPVIYRDAESRPIPVVFDDDHISVESSKMLKQKLQDFLSK